MWRFYLPQKSNYKNHSPFPYLETSDKELSLELETETNVHLQEGNWQ